MKNSVKLYLAAALILGTLISFCDSNSQTGRMKNGFYLGPINVYFYEQLHSSMLFGWYDSLHYNAMQNYSSHSDSTGYDWVTTPQRDGGFFEESSNYMSYIDNIIDLWHSHYNNNSLIFQREKVERGGYGQRSTYQAEYGQSYWANKFPKYGYNNINIYKREKTDDAYYGDNIVAKYCIANVDTAGYMVSGLIENAEQVNYYAIIPDTDNRNGTRLFSDIKQPHYNFKWHIKPRMRIDSIYAKANPYDTVAILRIINFQGDTIKKDPIICNHFLKYYGDTNYYDGKYLEMFYNLSSPQTNTPSTFSISADSLIIGRAGNNWHDGYVDYSIYWCGKVNTYLDYVRVDDDWAHYLFTDVNGDYSNNKFHQKIAGEVNAFGGDNSFGYFYIDEIFYNNIPCVAEVNRIIKSINPNTSMLIMNNIDRMFSEGGLKNELNDQLRYAVLDTMFSSGAEKDIYLDSSYPFYFTAYYPPNVSAPDVNQVPASVLFNKASTPAAYNEDSTLGIQPMIQKLLNFSKYIRMKAKDHNMDYALSIQVHSDEVSLRTYKTDNWGLREPTNEEIRMQCYAGLALGTKQLLQYSFYSYLTDSNYNSWGLAYPDWSAGGIFKKRLSNYYGQSKWNFVDSLNKKLRTIGDILYPKDSTSKHLIYDKTVSLNLGEYGNDYISNIQSEIINSNGLTHYHTESSIGTVDDSLYRYWEIGFFEPNPNNPDNPNDRSKYFLAVNKRCTPVAGNFSDERDLYIKFNNQHLPIFNNWKLIDALTNTEIFTFDKSSNSYYNAGRFLPGEGKLFKVVPVLQDGGTLVCDEEIHGITFDCDSIVNSNSYNITLYKGTNVTFSGTAYWVMNGGRFESGLTDNSQNSSADSVYLKGKTNSYWDGLSFNECDYVNIISTNISDILTYTNSTNFNYALKLVNCLWVNINGNNFESLNNIPCGAISVSIVNEPEENTGYTIIDNNKLSYKSASLSAVEINAFAGMTTPVYIRYNNFPQISSNSNNTAISLTEVSGGVISYNSITDYSTGLLLNSSTAYLLGNTITSSKSSSVGIEANASSYADLKPNSIYLTGGENNIIMQSYSLTDIITDNSYFDINNGYNTFDIPSDMYHFTGSFPGRSSDSVSAINNCYKIDGSSSTGYSDVVWRKNNNLVMFIFGTSNCGSEQDNMLAEIINISENSRDSIFRFLSGGNGGGMKENPEIIQESNTLKSLYDTLNLNLRRKHYNDVISAGKTILNTFPDSVKSFDVISKIYLSAIKSDSSAAAVQDIKSFYETLIQNNPLNTAIINQLFYYIQKCKVSLHQYSSAMQGFQYIIQQNPYTYEGLIASWDYDATSLLSQSGAYKDNDNELDIILKDTIKNQISLNNIRDEYDKTKFKKTDRTVIITNIETSITSEKEKQEKKLKSLELRAEDPKENEINKEAIKKEVKKMKTINETIKTKKPKSITEHIRNVSSDMKKIFNKNQENANVSIKDNIVIPKEFQLYQNYPNPFNPTTKISFDLPKDVRISIVIYDILGREVTKIINNEFRTAGKYITEFNASALSSGIYFYQIRAGEFIQAKKMLLVK